MSMSLPLRINLISLLFAALVATVLTALGGFFLHHQQEENAGVHARLAAEELASRARRLLELELKFGDFLNFDEQCAAVIRSDPTLRDAAVFDLQGRRLFHSGRGAMAWPLATRPLEGEGPRELQTPEGRFALQPIVRARADVQGYALVAVDGGVVLKKTLQTVGWLVASALALFAIGLVIQQLILWHTVGRPLAGLVRTADSIQPDSPSPLPLLPKAGDDDDIGRLYGAFARLMRRLLDARAELVAQNEQLESTVQERTAQLARVNSELARDIERRKQLEAELRALASTDPLTGLANRAFVLPYLERRILQARRSGESLCVMALDFDGFKAINDTHGHAAGDRVLQVMGQRIQASCRQSDVVARMGGDEFLIVAEPFDEPAQAQVLGQRLLQAFATPVDCGDKRLPVGASIGAAMFPQHGEDASALLAAADAAMYGVKQRRAGFAFAADSGPVRRTPPTRPAPLAGADSRRF